MTGAERERQLERRIARGQARQAQWEVRSRRLSWARLGVFVGGVALALIVESNPVAVVVVVLMAVLLFAWLVRQHGRVKRLLGRAEVWVNLHQGYLARARLEWEKIPALPASKPLYGHPFEIDLDISGERSLHHLLDTTVTLQGSDRLLGWLLQTQPDVALIQRRRDQIEALSLAYATRLTLAGRLAQRKGKLDLRPLLEWAADAPEGGVSGRFVAGLGALCLVNAVLFLLYQAQLIPPLFAVSFLLYLGLSLSRARYAARLLDDAFAVQQLLNGLSGVLSFIEQRRYPPALASLCQPFQMSGSSASQLRRLTTVIVSAASLRNNPIAWAILNAVMPWDLYATYRMGVLRRDLGERLPAWVQGWSELEALAALRLFAYLNPSYTEPEFVADSASPVFDTHDLGHPLLAHDRRVGNDFALQPAQPVILVTGSNMSGKSTFLRTLGINLTLANAGAVVCAGSLRLSPFRVYTCIKVSDSLVDGFSYFYAEVRRLKALLDALEQREGSPLFFLIDEIFKGTNNRERLIGSQAYLRALMGKRGVGVISTHDLELASLEGLLNQHFADSVKDDQLHFDYRLRQGVSPTTNALRIMQMAGLPVTAAPSSPAG